MCKILQRVKKAPKYLTTSNKSKPRYYSMASQLPGTATSNPCLQRWAGCDKSEGENSRKPFYCLPIAHDLACRKKKTTKEKEDVHFNPLLYGIYHIVDSLNLPAKKCPSYVAAAPIDSSTR